jgi:peptide/nickel transport system permease protein/oligopeptide transport system permease protein
VTAPIEVSGSDVEAHPEAVLAGMGGKVEGRSLGQIAWMRLRRDKVAMTGGVIVLLLVIMALTAPLLVRWFGYPPQEFHQEYIDPNLQRPLHGPWHSGISGKFLLGIEPTTGRDIFSRIVTGAWISLLIAASATMLSVIIGSTLGIIAGYFGGWVDTVIARAMDIFLAFPILLFAIALAGVVQGKVFGLQGNGLRIALLIFIIGFFNWAYIGRIIRGQTLSLREREFVDAARSMGARAPYILFRELLPNLLAPILVYSTLLIPTNILFEAALSYLGVGVNEPTPTWGGMLATAVPIYSIDPWFMLVPGLAIFVTVLAFNLFGDGLRDALDPRTR